MIIHWVVPRLAFSAATHAAVTPSLFAEMVSGEGGGVKVAVDVGVAAAAEAAGGGLAVAGCEPVRLRTPK